MAWSLHRSLPMITAIKPASVTKAVVRVSFYWMLPMILIQCLTYLSLTNCKHYNLSSYNCEEDNGLVRFVRLYVFQIISSLLFFPKIFGGPITERRAWGASSISRSLIHWLVINASGVSYYLMIARFIPSTSSLKENLLFDYNYSYSINELKVIICSSLFILMSSQYFFPTLNSSIPDALTSMGVYVSLVLQTRKDSFGYSYGYRIYLCVSTCSLIMSLFKYYVPYKSDVRPAFVTGVAVLGGAAAAGQSSPIYEWAIVLIILFGIIIFSAR